RPVLVMLLQPTGAELGIGDAREIEMRAADDLIAGRIVPEPVDRTYRFVIAASVDLRLDEHGTPLAHRVADSERPGVFVAVVFAADYNRRVGLIGVGLENPGRRQQPVGVL